MLGQNGTALNGGGGGRGGHDTLPNFEKMTY